VKVTITPQAAKVIVGIADFVESKNTPGSGTRYVRKFMTAIKRLAIPNVQYTICNHPILAAYRYSCTHFNDWTIAFRIIDNKELVVYEVIHGSLLS
jgi:plasmid stabilization system protein ParE